MCPCYREESTASENAEPVQLFWKTDKKSIHQIDDGNSTKSFSFGLFCSMYRIKKCVYWICCLLHLLYVHFPPLLFADRVFTAAETTNHLHQEIAKPLVVSTVEGYNGM